MTLCLTTSQLAHLSAVGMAIDGGMQPTVYDGGFVAIEPSKEKDEDNVEGQETGSQSGPRPGRRAWAWRAQASHHAFRSDSLELAHGAKFRTLARHYEAQAFEDKNGLWVTVASKPLGVGGPEVHFLIAVPTDEGIAPRAWAFEKIGPNARLMSLKHTNFPDASICAFAHGYWPWPNADGLLGLVDIYVLWAVRKLHRDHLGWWPGPQLGTGSLYRVKEFDPREACGCGSNKKYGHCHMATDLLANPQVAAAEFHRNFHCEYGDRRPHEQVIGAARSRWRSLPSMASVFAERSDPSQLKIR